MESKERGKMRKLRRGQERRPGEKKRTRKGEKARMPAIRAHTGRPGGFSRRAALWRATPSARPPEAKLHYFMRAREFTD